MEYISDIFSLVWSFFNIPLNFGSFEVSYAQVFIFSILISFVTIALFKFLWG